MRKPVCVIPARGGSTRIPRKNIKPFHGKPIIEYSIATANKCGLFSEIYVSTEDREIGEIASNAGAGIIWRPGELAKNEVGTQEVMQHACKTIYGDDERPEDIACCIYPTSPLMCHTDLRRGFDYLKINRNTYYAFSVGMNPLQDAGQFYFGYVTAFKVNFPLISPNSVMVPIAKDRVCDINTMNDFNRAEEMYAHLHR